MSQYNIDEEVEEIAGGEFERQPVPQSKLKSWKSFLGMYAGEHAAGTEFVIGPLFLTTGVSAFDLIVGLLLGNLLAVLSWRFLTAEIAVKYRLTLYYQLEKIVGKKLVIGYNLANGILFCFLAGAMITVSATAVGIPFDMEMPKLTDYMGRYRIGYRGRNFVDCSKRVRDRFKSGKLYVPYYCIGIFGKWYRGIA